MVQLNESVIRTGPSELDPSWLRPTIYRPSRPVTTRRNGTAVESAETAGPAEHTA